MKMFSKTTGQFSSESSVFGSFSLWQDFHCLLWSGGYVLLLLRTASFVSPWSIAPNRVVSQLMWYLPSLRTPEKQERLPFLVEKQHWETKMKPLISVILLLSWCPLPFWMVFLYLMLEFHSNGFTVQCYLFLMTCFVIRHTKGNVGIHRPVWGTSMF